MNVNSYLSYNPVGQETPASTSISSVSNTDNKQAEKSDIITGELVERQPHTSITIETWQHSRIHVETSNPISQKAISQYLLTQFAVERENIRQNIGIDTFA